MDLVRGQHTWARLMLTLAVACTPKETDVGFLASGSLFSGAQNCIMLETISVDVCAGETFPIHCIWGESFGRFDGAGGISATSAQTCDAALARAVQLAAEEGLLCEVVEGRVIVYEIQCTDEDTGDSGAMDNCSPLWVCSNL